MTPQQLREAIAYGCTTWIEIKRYMVLVELSERIEQEELMSCEWF